MGGEITVNFNGLSGVNPLAVEPACIGTVLPQSALGMFETPNLTPPAPKFEDGASLRAAVRLFATEDGARAMAEEALGNRFSIDPSDGAKKRDPILATLHVKSEVIDWGSFNLSDEDSLRAMAKLEEIVRRLTQDGDPSVEVVFVNSPQKNAFVTGDKDQAFVVLHRGLFDLIDNEDQLAGVIAHELAHTITFDKLERGEALVQRSREELMIADKLGIERMIITGYDPRQSIVLLEKLAAMSEYNQNGFYGGFFSSHPDYRLRISRAAAEVSQWDKKAAFSDPTPLDEILLKIQETKASKGRHSERAISGIIRPRMDPILPPEPRAPELPKKEATLSPTLVFNRMLQDPGYRALPAMDKLHVLGEFAAYIPYFHYEDPRAREGYHSPSILMSLLYLHYFEESDPRYCTPFNFQSFCAPDSYPDPIWKEYFFYGRNEAGMFQDPHNEIIAVALASEDEGVRLRASQTVWEVYRRKRVVEPPDIWERIFPTPPFENLADFLRFEERIKAAHHVGLVDPQRTSILESLYLEPVGER